MTDHQESPSPSRQTNEQYEGRSDLDSINAKLAVAAIASAVFYQPLVIWAANPWDLSSPEKLFLTAAPLLVVALMAYFVIVRLGARPGAIGLTLAGVIYLLMDWGPVGHFDPLLVLAGIVVTALLIQQRLGTRLVLWGQVTVIALLGVAPIVQVVAAHFQNQDPYPLVDLFTRTPSSATGTVEDVLVVVVDGYPATAIATEWFDHDNTVMAQRLNELGFRMAEVAWSHNTFTRLAIPSILELQTITEPGPKEGWGNFRPAYDIVRGDNFVADALTSAGFSYTHIESGWNGGVCASNVDTCLTSAWLDEAVWLMARPTVIGDTLASSVGSFSVVNTNRTVHHLESLDVFGDGDRDYVFAHLLLPHPPFVVDRMCQPIPNDEPAVVGLDEVTTGAVELAPVRAQLACADRLITRIAELAGPEAAILIAADHGTGLRSQGVTSDQEWTDADIAERLGIFLAYRLPFACSAPDMETNVAAMRAVLTCAVSVDLPTYDPLFLLGTGNPDPVDPDRLDRIESALLSGSLNSGLEEAADGS